MSEAQWTVVFAAYCSFWEPLAEANLHAHVRIEAIITAAEGLAAAPRGIHVLAVFFGGQDHQRRMLVRLLQNPPAANQ